MTDQQEPGTLRSGFEVGFFTTAQSTLLTVSCVGPGSNDVFSAFIRFLELSFSVERVVYRVSARG